MTQKSYSQRHQENKDRLTKLLGMRRAGKKDTAEYKHLLGIAMHHYYLLTAEAIETNRTKKLTLNT